MGYLLLLNGPNLNRLGRRRPDVYGTTTLADIEAIVSSEAAPTGRDVVACQANGEGGLIDSLERHRDADGVIINPGALMINGWSLRDALEDYPAPVIEVHLSNVWARESFRHDSVVSGVVLGVIAGFGAESYRLAAQALLARS